MTRLMPVEGARRFSAMAYVLATIGNGVDAGYRFPTD